VPYIQQVTEALGRESHTKRYQNKEVLHEEE